MLAQIILALLFGLVWSVLLIHADWHNLAPHFTRQYNSENFPSTSGQITHSEVERKINSKGKSRYSLVISYKYGIDGKEYETGGFHYNDNLWTSSDVAWAQTIVSAYPIGTKIQVHYNPLNPADAVLSPGITGDDVMVLLTSLPLYIMMLCLAAALWPWLYRVIFRPPGGWCQDHQLGSCSPCPPAVFSSDYSFDHEYVCDFNFDLHGYGKYASIIDGLCRRFVRWFYRWVNNLFYPLAYVLFR